MARAATARSSGAPAAKRSTIRNPRERTPARRVAPPLEHRILMTAALCLLAFGAVMVYSASSPLGVIGGRGYGTGEFVRYLVFGALGLAGMHLLARRGMDLLNERMVRTLLIVSFSLLVLVMVPGFGVQVNGARRWFAAGPIQFQPSELMKLALVLYVARYLADHPKRMRGFRQAIAPVAVVVGPALPADRGRAGPRHGAGDRFRDRRAAGRGRDAGSLSGAAGGDRHRGRDHPGAGPAL